VLQQEPVHPRGGLVSGSPTFSEVGLGIGLILWKLAVCVFIAVAIWRSATKYEGPRGWAWLAKFTVIVGLLRLALRFLGALGIIS
jgi:hypothetical protein